jgi:hypothetical protein
MRCGDSAPGHAEETAAAVLAIAALTTAEAEEALARTRADASPYANMLLCAPPLTCLPL